MPDLRPIMLPKRALPSEKNMSQMCEKESFFASRCESKRASAGSEKRNKVLHITQNDDDSSDEDTQKFWVGALEKSETANCWFAHVQVQGESLKMKIRGHIDKFCLQVHNFGNNEVIQMILTPHERSFYVAPDDISFSNIITVPFDTEPPPTDDLLDAVSEKVSSLVSAPRKNSNLHIFVCLVTIAFEVILDFWKKEEIARSKIWAIRRVR